MGVAQHAVDAICNLRPVTVDRSSCQNGVLLDPKHALPALCAIQLCQPALCCVPSCLHSFSRRHGSESLSRRQTICGSASTLQGQDFDAFFLVASAPVTILTLSRAVRLVLTPRAAYFSLSGPPSSLISANARISDAGRFPQEQSDSLCTYHLYRVLLQL